MRLRQERGEASRRARFDAFQRSRQELHEILSSIRARLEATESVPIRSNYSDSSQPFAANKRARIDEEEKRLRIVQGDAYKRLNSARFHTESRDDKLKLIRSVTTILKKLRKDLNQNEYDMHYNLVRKRLKEIKVDVDTSIERKNRSRERTNELLMGVPRPALPAPIEDVPAIEANDESSPQQASQDVAHAQIRSMLMDNQLRKQFNRIGFFFRPVSHNGDVMEHVLLTQPPSASCDMGYKVPSVSNRTKPSYKRQISFVLTLKRFVGTKIHELLPNAHLGTRSASHQKWMQTPAGDVHRADD